MYNRINDKGVVPPLAYLILVCGLIAIQPDFGTAGIIALIALAMIVSSGMNFKNFAKLVIIGMIVVLPVLLVLKGQIFSSKRVDRIAVLKDPFAVEQTSGYHLPIHILQLVQVE